MSDRIGCINPACRRTAPREKYPNTEWIICRKCWNSLPEKIRREHKAVRRRNSRLDRLGNKPQFGESRSDQWRRIADLFDRAVERLDATIVAYFTNPPEPAGLDNFMKEMGFNA